jgi:hypothetical protein
MSKRVLYNITSASLQATNISGGTINAATFTGGNLSLSGDLKVAGTLTTVNITSTNLVNTNVSAGVVVASTLLSATGNSNTIGSIFTTGGNVGIGTTSPESPLHITSIMTSATRGGIHLGVDGAGHAAIQLNTTNSGGSAGAIIDFGYTGIDYLSRIISQNDNKSLTFLVNGGTSAMALNSSGSVSIPTLTNTNAVSTNITSTNIVATNITSATLNLSTGLTSASARISNAVLTNISTNSIIVDNNNVASGMQIGVGTGNTTSNLNLYGSYIDGYAIIQAGSTTNTTNANLRFTRSATVNSTLANFQVYSQTSSFLGGNVGINTSAPTSALSIVASGIGGNIRVAPTTANNETGIGFYTNSGFTVGSTGDYWSMGLGAWFTGSRGFGIGSTNLNNVMTLSSQGNVGIGTTSPTSALHVNGTISVTTITGGNMSLSGNISLLAGNRITTAIGDNFTYSTNTVPQYGLMWAADAGSADGPMAYLTGYGGIRFFTLGQPRMVINSASGNVGIGTTSPSEKLTVNGNIRIGAASDLNADYSIKSGGQLTISANDASTQDAAFTSLSLTSGVSSNTSLITVVGSSTLKHITFSTSNTDRMRIDSAGNVGIGTTSPGSILHVAGAAGSLPTTPSGNGIHMGIDTNSNSGIQLNSGSNGSVNYEYIDFGYSGVETVARIIHNNANRSLLFQVNSGTNAMQLNSTGSVSITGPGDVGTNGSLLITGRDANTQSLYIAGVASQKRIAFGHSGTVGSILAYDYGSGVAQNLCFQLGGANVGIGTASPTALLHILESTANNTNPSNIFVDKNGERAALQVWNYNNNTSNLQLSSNMYWNNSGSGTVHNTLAGKAWNLTMGSNQDSLRVARFTSADTSSTLFTINSAGNVGIGTTSPLAKLHIVGGEGTMTSAARGYFRYNDGYVLNSGGWGAMSIYASTDIVSGGYIASHGGTITTSDSRIKKNIEDINPNIALEILRQIKPKTYKFKDNIKNEDKVIYGFIAQEIKTIVPESIHTTKREVPNIFELADVSDGNKIILTKNSTSILKIDDEIMLYDSKNTEIKAFITNIIDDYTFIIDKQLNSEQINSETINNKIFVYGQIVDDFLYLNKEYLFTITTSALQEIDQQLQSTKDIISNQKTEINDLKSDINYLKQTINDLILRNNLI